MPSESIRSLCTIYNDQGIVYLNEFLGPQCLKAVRQDILTAEEIALKDLRVHWGDQKITFFTKNPTQSVSAENSEDFVVTPYFQRSSDSVHIFFEEIENKLVLNRLI